MKKKSNLTQSGGYINVCNKNSVVSLHIVAGRGDQKLFELLISQKVINSKCSCIYTSTSTYTYLPTL